MNWLEVSVQVTHAAAEAAADILTAQGTQGVAIDDPQLINDLRASNTWELCDIPEQENTEIVTISAYYAEDEKLAARLANIDRELAAVEERIGPCRFGPAKFRTVSESDWANEWKQYFHVTHVGKSLVIKPSWENYAPAPGEKVIGIDPGMAFGTGTHHTTNMCMERLEAVLAEKKDALVFDVGSGSGILSVAAALCGARAVKAVDIDGVAVRVARENVAANKLSDVIEVREGDLLHGTEGVADVIVANIIADIIILLLPDIPGKLAADGVFLASGIITERRADVEKAAAANGLRLAHAAERGGWVVLEFKRA